MEEVLKCVTSWQGVHRYCTELSQSMNLSNTEQYEITGVNVLAGEVHMTTSRLKHTDNNNSLCMNTTALGMEFECLDDKMDCNTPQM